MAIGYESPDDYLTVKQTARLLNITPLSVYRLIREGRLPSYQFGTRSVRIKRGEIFRAHPKHQDKVAPYRKSV